MKHMAYWRWRGRDRSGVWCAGELEGDSRQAVSQAVQAQGVQVLHVRRCYRWRTHLPAHTITWMVRQLATLLAAGVPLVAALQGLSRPSVRGELGALLQGLAQQLQAGLPLSHALARYPVYFDSGFCRGVAAGELAGMLEQTLLQLVSEREKRQRLQARVHAALIYPVVILLMALGVLALMLLTVIPAFRQAFSAFGHALPPATRWLLASVDWLQSHGIWLLAWALALLWLLALGWRRSPGWQRVVQRASLHLPLLGVVMRQAILVRWARCFSLLFAAGIPLLEVLEAAGRAAGNSEYLEASLALQRSIRQGCSLTQALRRQSCFPALVLQLAAVGEASGTLDQVFEQVALYYEEQVEVSVQWLTSLLEPLAMLLLGSVCALLIWVLYLPVFQLGQVVG